MVTFAEWQQTRKEISLQQLEEMYAGTSETFGFNEAPPEKIFEYDGGAWITQQRDGEGSYFWTFIERDDYTSEDVETLEMRLFLYSLDEGYSF